MTEKENHLPNLSSGERAHALELAIQARRRYAALKARVKSGELTFTDAMFRASVRARRSSLCVCTGFLKAGVSADSASDNAKRWLLWKRTDGNSAHLNSAIRDVSELGALARLKGNLSRWEPEVAAPRVLGFRASRKPRRKGMGKGAAAPPFPCLFCARTDRISVLTGQGRSSSCKIWEAYIQSHVNETFPYTSILLPSGFRSLDGRTLTLNESTI